MGIFSKLFGKKTPISLQELYWAKGWDIETFSKATDVSINTLNKYSGYRLDEIPARTRNKIKKVLDV